jgi:hypothetical protein
LLGRRAVHFSDQGSLRVQTTLLGLAIAIILAIVAALVAPLVVDWNQYRSTFEEQASRLIGLPVRVNGTIDARILPTPHIKLHNVEVGAADRQPLLRTSTIELEVGLGPLLRGEVRATELRLVAPQISVGLDQSGAIDWPAPTPAFRPDALTISGLTIEDGRVILTDAGSGAHLILQKFWFKGDIRSLSGPFHGEGAFVVGDDLYGYRLSGDRAEEDGGLKLRLGIEASNQPLTAEVEGRVDFDRGVPQFVGTLALARPVGVTLAHGERVLSDPWQLAGKVRLTPAVAALQDLALQYGPEERALNLTGKADLTFGAQPRVDGTVSAQVLDVDRALAAPDLTHQPPLVMIKRLFEALFAAVRPPVPVALSVAVEAVTVGGATIQSVHGNVGIDAKEWRLSDFAFRAPGLTDVTLSGHFSDSAQGVEFSGPAKLESADLKMLMAWLEGRNERPLGAAETLTARGDVTVAGDHFGLERLSATLDQENLQGRLVYTWAVANRPASLDGELRAATLNIDALASFVKTAASDGALEIPHQVALVLDVDRATYAGVDARAVNARVKFNAGILHIDRLSIGDLGGAAIDISGRIDELSSQPRGRLALDIDARTLTGVTSILGRLAPQVADSFLPFADRVTPVKLHGVLSIDRAATAGTTAKLDLGGDVGALRLTLNGEATGEPAHPDAAVLRIASRVDADDGGALLRLLELDRVVAVDQLPGQMTISATGPLDGAIRINGVATAGGFSAAVDGMLRLTGNGAPTGSLRLKASAADLRPLHRAMTGQSSAIVPISTSATIAISGPNLSSTDLAATVGKASLHGRLALKLSSPVGIDGDVAIDNADAWAISAMLLGLPSAGPAVAWSPEPIGAGAFGALNGAVTFKVDRAALTPTLVAHNLKGVLRLQPAEIAIGNIEASLAGGGLTGALAFRHDTEKLGVGGHIELVGAQAAALLASTTKAINGLVTVKLQGDSLGPSPDAIVGALHGSGTISLKDAQFAGIASAAFDAAVRAADQSGSFETSKIRAAVGAAMEKGRLTIPQTDAELTITGGQIHLSNALLRTQHGAELTLDGVVDLNNTAIDARLTLSGQPDANALIAARPELAIILKGPLAAPEKTLDVSQLVAWLTLRATELQTRRLESIEANRREEVSSPAVRPASPTIRFIPMGTPLETADHATLSAPPTLGARAFDRLQPEVPAATPSPSSPGGLKPTVPHTTGADKTTATAGAADPAHSVTPAPAPHAPLDLLFRSQN